MRPEQDHEAGRRRTLPPPAVLLEQLPRDEGAAARVERARRAIQDVIHGRDRDRLVVIAGPCSIHDREAALEYAARLARVAARNRDRLVVVMRTYFEKPRTTVGWKGWIHDPHLDGSGDVATGLWRARALLREIHGLGLPCASELLDPMIAPYLRDLLSWVAIGARTSESQLHRELASGLPLPVGFKNGTSGDVQVAANAVRAAQEPHSALGIDGSGVPSWLRTAGNPDGHLVLRGGARGPNYFPEPVAHAVKWGREAGLERPVMVDCSHDNSGQDPRRQRTVCRAVLEQVAGADSGIAGLLLESHLQPGRQRWRPGAPLAPGVSITDGCIGWEETEALLGEIAAAVPGLHPSRGARRGALSGAS